MLNIISNLNLDNVILITVTITISISGITYIIFRTNNQFSFLTRVSELDPIRIQQGLPTDVTLTPEDFIENPELAEIFDVTDPNTYLDVPLESNQHFEYVQDQMATGTYDNLSALLDVIVAYISTFF